MKRAKITLLACALFCGVIAHANPQNSVAEICRDLVGHVVTEGTNNGYYSGSWRWTIEDGEISNFSVLSIRENTSDRYTIDVLMHLSARPNSIKYAVKATVYYVRSYSGWYIDMVKSRGMSVVRTYYYDGCIRSYLDDGGIQGTRVALENNCDVTLEVGGRTYDEYDGWEKFSITVSPHDDAVVGHFISDYIIDYVERP